MNEELLMKFVEWLPTKFEELKGKTPEEIVSVVNNMASSEEGKTQLEQLIKQFQSESVGTFKKGGKLDYFITKFSKGGENKKIVKEGKKNKNFNRVAYRNSKRALKENSDLSRRDRKALAMEMALDPYKNIPINEIVRTAVQSVPEDKMMQITIANTPLAKTQLSPIKTQNNYDHMSFNKAFATARSLKESTFNWRGNNYNTQLKNQKNPSMGDRGDTLYTEFVASNPDIYFKDSNTPHISENTYQPGPSGYLANSKPGFVDIIPSYEGVDASTVKMPTLNIKKLQVPIEGDPLREFFNSLFK